MFQKSLQILIMGTLVALGVIVAYAALRLSGPHDALDEAQAKMVKGQFAQAISVLDMAEQSSTGDRELLERLWRLRYQANSQLGNARGALRDVANLLQNGNLDDIDLRLEQIRLLAQSGDGERARLLAKAFLADHPDHSRGLELAGEACQTIYQPELGSLREAIEREIAGNQRTDARKALLAYVYRPHDDPEVERAKAVLQRMFAAEPRLVALWPQIQAQADSVRERVQEGLSYFQRSLDSGGEPVAAFRAVATALEQSGRTDDLLLSCEIQRHQFDHDYVDEAGVIASWAYLGAGLPKAAIAATRRWLPDRMIQERLAAETLGPAADELLLVQSVAARQLGDPTELNRTLATLQLVNEAEHPIQLPLNIAFVAIVLLDQKRDQSKIDWSVRFLAEQTLRRPAVLDRPDLAAEFAPLWIDYLIARDAGEGPVLAALQTWRQGRPRSAAPDLRAAEYLLLADKATAAYAAIAAATELEPDNEALFPLRLRAARRRYEGSSQDGAGLLEQCERRRNLVPETTDAIGFVLCAEAAMQKGDPQSLRRAAACARSAVDAFPRADLPRRLELAALLADNRVTEARRAADRALAAIVPEADTLELILAAKRLAGESMRPVVRATLPATPATPGLQLELLRIALADAPSTALQFVSEDMLGSSPRADVVLLASSACSAIGAIDRSMALFERITPAAAAECRDTAADAFRDWLRAAGPVTPDAELLPAAVRVRDRLSLATGPQLQLLTAAAELSTTHPLTAAALLVDALAQADAEQRTGTQLVLAGRLALARGDRQRAEQYWLAAIGFDDGQIIAEDLARLLLAAGESARAQTVYQLVDTPTDAAMAARFDHPDRAEQLLAKAIADDPGDLVAQAVAATLGRETPLDWRRPDDDETRNERLELLASLREPDVARLVVDRCARLLSDDRGSVTARLLLARAATAAADGRRAVQLHLDVLASGFVDLILWREVAVAEQLGRDREQPYVPDLALLVPIIQHITAGTLGDSALTRDWGLTQIERGFAQSGSREQAEQALIALALVDARLKRWTAADLDVIETRLDKGVACSIFDRILQASEAIVVPDRSQGTVEAGRRALLDRYYRLAPLALLADASLASDLVGAATRHVASFGALGQIVHFLLDPQMQAAVATTDVDVGALLLAHLEQIARGRDDTQRLDLTIDALLAALGLEATAARIETLLDAYPTSVPLWTARTQLRLRLNNDPRTLAELRTVLTHAHDARAMLVFLGLAAASRSLLPADFERLAALPAELRESPQGSHVQGLIALHQGDATQAIAQLSTGRAQHDGRHLFALALAHLESDAPSSRLEAIDKLEQLQRDYPNSALARNVGSFVRQLSPRAASAADKDTNR